jgi:hypothetical protein
MADAELQAYAIKAAKEIVLREGAALAMQIQRAAELSMSERFFERQGRQRAGQPRTPAAGAEARHRRRQDHRHGDADRLADGQRGAPPGSKQFTRGFLIVTPGITIRTACAC